MCLVPSSDELGRGVVGLEGVSEDYGRIGTDALSRDNAHDSDVSFSWQSGAGCRTAPWRSTGTTDAKRVCSTRASSRRDSGADRDPTALDEPCHGSVRIRHTRMHRPGNFSSWKLFLLASDSRVD